MCKDKGTELICIPNNLRTEKFQKKNMRIPKRNIRCIINLIRTSGTFWGKYYIWSSSPEETTCKKWETTTQRKCCYGSKEFAYPSVLELGTEQVRSE